MVTGGRLPGRRRPCVADQTRPQVLICFVETWRLGGIRERRVDGLIVSFQPFRIRVEWRIGDQTEALALDSRTKKRKHSRMTESFRRGFFIFCGAPSGTSTVEKIVARRTAGKMRITGRLDQPAFSPSPLGRISWCRS